MKTLLAFSLASFSLVATTATVANAANSAQQCNVTTGARATPVIELYTSEGCNSCPPADRWLSQRDDVRRGDAIALAFHVDYWDYIGWKDRFANPQFSARQHEGAARRNSRQVYTPQVVVNGEDFRWSQKSVNGSTKPAPVQIALNAKQQNNALSLDAKLTLLDGAPAKLGAYWAVTEDMHVSKVTAGENARETLKHDYVVTQYLPVAEFNATPSLPPLRWVANGVNAASNAQHKQRVHLVVTDAATGTPLQVASVLNVSSCE